MRPTSLAAKSWLFLVLIGIPFHNFFVNAEPCGPRLEDLAKRTIVSLQTRKLMGRLVLYEKRLAFIDMTQPRPVPQIVGVFRSPQWILSIAKQPSEPAEELVVKFNEMIKSLKSLFNQTDDQGRSQLNPIAAVEGAWVEIEALGPIAGLAEVTPFPERNSLEISDNVAQLAIVDLRMLNDKEIEDLQKRSLKLGH